LAAFRPSWAYTAAAVTAAAFTTVISIVSPIPVGLIALTGFGAWAASYNAITGRHHRLSQQATAGAVDHAVRSVLAGTRIEAMLPHQSHTTASDPVSIEEARRRRKGRRYMR
jgi:hypothetical protein